MTNATIKRKTVSPAQKATISKATARVVKQYGKTLKLLSKE